VEDGELRKAMLERIDAESAARGLLPHKSTVHDARFIAAPPSTRSEARARDAETHQTRQGNQWHFGCQAHIGADLYGGMVHTLTVTAAEAADVTQTEHTCCMVRDSRCMPTLIDAGAVQAGAQALDQATKTIRSGESAVADSAGAAEPTQPPSSVCVALAPSG
jgi:hypothetical protein